MYGNGMINCERAFKIKSNSRIAIGIHMVFSYGCFEWLYKCFWAAFLLRTLAHLTKIGYDMQWNFVRRRH